MGVPARRPCGAPYLVEWAVIVYFYRSISIIIKAFLSIHHDNNRRYTTLFILGYTYGYTMKHYCVHCKRFVDDTKALYIRTSDKGSRSWKPVRYICNSCLEIRPQPLPPRTDGQGESPKKDLRHGLVVETCDPTRKVHLPHYWLSEDGDFMSNESERLCPGCSNYRLKTL